MLNIRKFIKGFRILNDADHTKSLEVSVSNSATTNTKTILQSSQTDNRTLTLPDSTSTLADINSPQTFTNKTLVVSANTVTTAASGNLVATELNAALAELQTDIDTRALNSDLQNHINATVDAHDASAISVVPAGNLSSTDVQAALEELQTNIDGFSAGANQNLSNLLAPTAINQNLLPSGSQTLGSTASPWNFLSVQVIDAHQQMRLTDTLGNLQLQVSKSGVAPSGPTLDIVIVSKIAAGSLGVITDDGSASGDLFLETGNSFAGASGDITLKTGTATTTRGNINIDPEFLVRNLNSVEVTTNQVAKNISLTASATNEVIAALTTNVTNYKSMIIKYSATINSKKRTGTIHVAATATDVSIADSFVETALCNFSFNAIISGGNIQIRHTNTEAGPLSITLDITRIRE